MRYIYHSEQWLPYPVDQVFAFFANPENLPRLMPPWQKARIEEAAFAPPPPRPVSSLSQRSITAGPGTRITFSFRPFPYSPIRIPWEAEIDEFVWNSHFADRQLRGPFAYWHHRHTVASENRINDGVSTPGTVLRDEIEYEPPLGLFGNIANSFFIARQLNNTFTYRKHRTSAILGKLLNFPSLPQK
jgi:ligand-binding SRPBCC domain-containing protein